MVWGAGVPVLRSPGETSWCEWKNALDITGALVLIAPGGAGCCD